MAKQLSTSAKRVQEALQAAGVPLKVVELPSSTRTAQEAANAVGCGTERIAKSLIFKLDRSKQPVLVIASGINRVNEKKLSALTGEPIAKADADFVRRETGYAIGGIPPLGHIKPIKTFIDEDLMQYDFIWAAAGTPHALFEISPRDLETVTGGLVTTIKK